MRELWEMPVSHAEMVERPGAPGKLVDLRPGEIFKPGRGA